MMPFNDILQKIHSTNPFASACICWYPFERETRLLDLSAGCVCACHAGFLEYHCNSSDYERNGKHKFDYIVVFDPNDFTVAAFSEFRAKLKPNGRLIFAYENPFALRYWAGKKVSNAGCPYDTLFGRGSPQRPSQVELRTRLKLAGFEGQKWYYPLTDHWFAREIYSENYLPNEYLNQRFAPYIADDGFLQFDERDLYREVIRGGAFEFMCGAYLVEARCDGNSPPCPVDYAAVTAYREPAKRFATVIRNDDTVHKIPLHPDGLESVRRIHQNHQDLASLGIDVLETRIVDGSLHMPRMNLPTLWDYWASKLSHGIFDENEMIGHFDRIRDSIVKASANGRCYWELVPANCFYDETKDRMLFFDQEFYYENVSTDTALARAIGAIQFSSRVFSDDPRSEHWLSVLLERYGLAERRDEFFSTIVPATDAEVFGHGAAALEAETWRATSAILERKRSAEERRCRYEKISPASGILREMGYKSPIIYGYGKRGQTLSRVLVDSGLKVAATVDRENRAFSSLEQVPSGTEADVLIVSIFGGQSIADELRTKTTLPVFTLEELIDG